MKRGRSVGLALTLVLIVAACASPRAPLPGNFVPTGSMTQAREHQVAVLLTDGRVLIVAGNDADLPTTASAELYDPQTGAFSGTGSMHWARAYFAATLLRNGEVLIVGGFPDDEMARDGASSAASIKTAELYDPRTGTFRLTGSMSIGRVNPTSTLLSDGEVLVAGGTTKDGSILASAELFDPRTGTFRSTGSMIKPRAGVATLLATGHVLIAEGDGGDGTSAELYDPASRTFRATGSMAVDHSFTSTLLPDGDVLFVGALIPVTRSLRARSCTTRGPASLGRRAR